MKDLKNVDIMYLDFDNTCYNTVKLTDDMLNVLIKNMEVAGLEPEAARQMCKENFCREITYDIFELVDLIKEKTKTMKKTIDSEKIEFEIKKIIQKGTYLDLKGQEKTYLFSDVEASLKKIKVNYPKIKICILTSVTSAIRTQYLKIKNSKILDFEYETSDGKREKIIDGCIMVISDKEKYKNEIEKLIQDGNFCVDGDYDYDIGCTRKKLEKIMIAEGKEKFNLEGLSKRSIAVDDRTVDIIGLRNYGIKYVFAINREEGKGIYKEQLKKFLEDNEDARIIGVNNFKDLTEIL